MDIHSEIKPIADKAVRYFKYPYRNTFPEDELTQIVWVTMLDAYPRWDKEGAANLSTFLIGAARKALIRAGIFNRTCGVKLSGGKSAYLTVGRNRYSVEEVLYPSEHSEENPSGDFYVARETLTTEKEHNYHQDAILAERIADRVYILAELEWEGNGEALVDLVTERITGTKLAKELGIPESTLSYTKNKILTAIKNDQYLRVLWENI